MLLYRCCSDLLDWRLRLNLLAEEEEDEDENGELTSSGDILGEDNMFTGGEGLQKKEKARKKAGTQAKKQAAANNQAQANDAVIADFVSQLRSYRSLKRELSSWTVAFAADHGRPPVLMDVERTGEKCTEKWESQPRNKGNHFSGRMQKVLQLISILRECCAILVFEIRWSNVQSLVRAASSLCKKLLVELPAAVPFTASPHLARQYMAFTLLLACRNTPADQQVSRLHRTPFRHIWCLAKYQRKIGEQRCASHR